jgi:hypothetical protein
MQEYRGSADCVAYAPSLTLGSPQHIHARHLESLFYPLGTLVHPRESYPRLQGAKIVQGLRLRLAYYRTV